MIIKLPFRPDPRIQFIRNLVTRQLVLRIEGVVIHPWDDIETTPGYIRPATLFVHQMLQSIARGWPKRERKVAKEFIAQAERPDNRQRDRLAFVFKQYEIALSPEKPLQQSLTAGAKVLNFWCDLLEQRPKIQSVQEEQSAKNAQPWTACLIQGQAVLPYQIQEMPGQECGVYYVLVPQVDTLGITGGSGLLTFYASPNAQEAAQRAFELGLEDMKKCLLSRSWDETAPREVDEDGVTLAAAYTDDITGRFTKEDVKTPEGKQMPLFSYIVQKHPDGTYDNEYFRFGADFEKVPCDEPLDYKTLSWGSYLTFADLRAHQFSLMDYAARSCGNSINKFDGTLLNLT